MNIFTLLLSLLAFLLPGLASASAVPDRKVMVVVLENTDYEKALSLPGFAALARRGALLTEMSGEAHPSQPNYLALISGDTQGVKSDNDASRDASRDARHLGDLLDAGKRSWKAYLEGYPGGCFAGSERNGYVRKHNPFATFKNVRSSAEQCRHLVPATELEADLKHDQLPSFSLYIPDIRNDGHDTDAAYADRWLSTRLLPLLESRLAKDLQLIVTFDESQEQTHNHIYTALVGAGVEPGSHSSLPYNHYSLLRTIEDELRLDRLGNHDARAASLSGIWSRPAPSRTAAQAASLKIVSYNVWGLPSPMLRHPERFEALPRAIDKLDADVVLIQEAFTSKANALTRLPHFPYVARGPGPRFMHFGSGLLILSRYPIRSTDTVRYTACGGFDCFANKGAQFARIELPGHRFVDVFNTHLNANGHARARALQSAQLLEFVHRHATDQAPTVVGGDFNGDIPNLPASLRFDPELRDAHAEFVGQRPTVDLDTLAGFTQDPGRNPYLAGGGDPTRRIDHIFLVDGPEGRWKVLDSRLVLDGSPGAPVLSDHFGARVQAELSSAQTRLVRRL